MYQRYIHRWLYRLPALYDLAAPRIGTGKVWRRVAQLLNPRQGERILDVCCGTGALLQEISHHSPGTVELFGLDHSPRMLERAQRKLNSIGARFVLSEAQAMPFPGSLFDKVTLTLALHEIPGPVRKQVLSELARVTLKGGRVILAEPIPPANPILRLILYTVEVPQWVREMQYLEDRLNEVGLRMIAQEHLYDSVKIIVAEKA